MGISTARARAETAGFPVFTICASALLPHDEEAQTLLGGGLPGPSCMLAIAQPALAAPQNTPASPGAEGVCSAAQVCTAAKRV